MDNKNQKELLREILPGNAITAGHRGDHLQSDCAFCGKSDHFYINWQRAFRKSGKHYIGCWDCKKCGEAGSLPRLLKQLGRLDIITGIKQVDLNKKLESKIRIEKEEDLELEVGKKRPPMGWRRIYESDYLASRGFTPEDFQKYKIGITKIFPKYKDYTIILIEEDDECKGYIARSDKSKEELKAINQAIKEYNEAHPDKKKRKVLRYDNSPATDFSKLLFGINELTEKTKCAILVEGFTDKHNVDKILKLDRQEEVKCLASFGKKISPVQIAKLQQKGIQSIILLFDPDAIKDAKKYAFELNRYFHTLVGFLKEKDPGDLTEEELENVLDSLEEPLNFNVNKVQKHELE